jgi:hypothetical protein
MLTWFWKLKAGETFGPGPGGKRAMTPTSRDR